MKKFLENNKIYFETLATILLAVMAIIVSINANKITTNQLNLEYHKSQPQFKVNRTITENNTESINILCDHKTASNIKVQTLKLWTVTTTIENVDYSTRYLINDFFAKSDSINNGGNNHIVLSRKDNIKTLLEYKNEMDSQLEEKSTYNKSLFGLQTIIEISYNNVLNETKQNYFVFVDNNIKNINRLALEIKDEEGREYLDKLFKYKREFNKRKISLYLKDVQEKERIINQLIESLIKNKDLEEL